MADVLVADDGLEVVGIVEIAFDFEIVKMDMAIHYDVVVPRRLDVLQVVLDKTTL